jgi:hypothetical protein
MNEIVNSGILRAPRVEKTVDDYMDDITDYSYKVSFTGNRGSKGTLRVHRNTYTFIREVVENIARKGYYEGIRGHMFNREYRFLAINVKNAGFKEISWEDVDVYLIHNQTKERVTFNMHEFYKVNGLAFSNTGKRTLNAVDRKKKYHLEHNIDDKNELTAFKRRSGESHKKNTAASAPKRRSRMSEEERIAKRRAYSRDYYQRNKEKCVEKSRAYRKNNKEKINQSMTAWRKKNPDKCRQYARNYYNKHKGNKS